MCVSHGGYYQKQARAFREHTGYTGELYVDNTTTGDVGGGLHQPQARSYAALKLKRGASVLSAQTSTLFNSLKEQGIHNKVQNRS